MMTGKQYMESLNDGRATYFAGRRVVDFDDEPAFSTPAGTSPTTTTSSTAPSPTR
jgi:aromatic ring hydroxylase